jgi:hypothetical protein
MRDDIIMMPIALNLLVLKSPSPGELAGFYGKVGLACTRERHGDGPEHFAAVLAHGGVIEIYPAAVAGRTTFGLSVESPADFRLKWLDAGGRAGTQASVLIDPEGNVVIVG